MDPSIPGANPANNPRLNLLSGTGGAAAGGTYNAGAYTATPASSSPQPSGAAAAPRSATSYISAAQQGAASGPAPAPSPTNAPQRPSYTPMYTGGSSGGSDGGNNRAVIAIVGVILLLIIGGAAIFAALGSKGEKQVAEAPVEKADTSNLTTVTIKNSDSIETKTLHVTGTEEGVDALVVDGSSYFQGPVKTGGDLSVGGNLTVTGEISATKFVGDGSALTGLNIPAAAPQSNSVAYAARAGSAGAAGSANTAGYATRAGYATNAGRADTAGHADTAGYAIDCDPAVCVKLQSGGVTFQNGSIGVGGTVASLTGFQSVIDATGTAASATVSLLSSGSMPANASYAFRIVAYYGNSAIGVLSPTQQCVVTNNSAQSCKVDWTDLPEADIYRVYISSNGGASFNAYATVSGSTNTFTYATGVSTIANGGGVVPTATTVLTSYMGGYGSNYTLNSFGIGTNSPTAGLDVNGTARIAGDIQLEADAAIAGDLTVGNRIDIDDGTDSTALSAIGIATTGNINANGNISSNSVLTGSVTSTGGVSASGTIAGATLQATGVVSGASFTATGAINGGSLAISGAATAASFAATGAVSGASATISGALSVASNNFRILAVSGHMQGTTVELSSSLTANGLIHSDAGYTTRRGGSMVSGLNKTCSGSNKIRITEITGGIITGAASNCEAFGADTVASGADLAEVMPSADALTPGDVVATAGGESVGLTTTSGQVNAIGVVSTNPGYTLAAGDAGYKVALAGRVPVKIDGAVAAGDYLSASSTPGRAKKAGAGERAIGVAMTSGSGGTVIVFVNPTTVPGGVVAETQQSVQQGPTSASENGSFADLNASGTTTLATLKVTGTAEIANLTVTGLAKVADIQITGHITGNSDTRGSVTIPAGATSATKAFTTAYNAVPVVVASPVDASASYHVTPTANGFTVTVDEAPTAPLKFNYLVQQ